MYTIWLCYNGRKGLVASKYVYNNKHEWRWDKERLPYDILDEDDFNVWFDYGDL